MVFFLGVYNFSVCSSPQYFRIWNLSKVSVSSTIVGLRVSRPLAIVSSITRIAKSTVAGVSESTIVGLGVSRPLAIVSSITRIAESTVAGISDSTIVGLGVSRPLAIGKTLGGEVVSPGG